MSGLRSCAWCPPASPTGVDDLGIEALPFVALGHHLGRIEHVDAGAIKRRSNLQAGGHIMTIREQLLRLRQHEIKHEYSRMRMRRIAADRSVVRMRYNRIKREPVD